MMSVAGMATAPMPNAIVINSFRRQVMPVSLAGEIAPLLPFRPQFQTPLPTAEAAA
jgi:hypothetical protein